MATSVPRPQSPQQTFQFTPTSPPDSNRAPFNKSRQSVRGYRFPLAQQPSTESRRSGHGATNGSMPVPDAAHPFTTNGEPPRRSRMSMNGMPPHAARSPPNAKSLFVSKPWGEAVAYRTYQIHPMFLANFSDSANVKPARPARSPTRSMFRLSTRPANTSPR